VNLFISAFEWLFSPERLIGSNSVPLQIRDHLFYTIVSVVIATIIAVPLGYFIGHTGKGRQVAIGVAGAARALPSFGLILFFVLVFGVLRLQFSVFAAFVILAIPSILAGAYAGLEAIDRRTIDAARAVGMTEWQILIKVEIPLGLPLLIGGIRNAILQVVATATLAAFVGLGGLGYGIFQGLAVHNFDQMLATALLIVALALILDGIFAVLQRLAEPRGLTAVRPTRVRTPSTRQRAVVGFPTDNRKG
jgi:osmoprotectant transport system permease protein